MTIAADVRERIVPVTAGWYASEHPGVAATAPRYASHLMRGASMYRPPGSVWYAAAETVELFEEIGIEKIYRHDLALANRLRIGLDLEPDDSAIVSIAADDDDGDRLSQAGIKTSVRNGRIRLSCHLYNDGTDVDRALEALAGHAISTPA